ncbi:MAG: acyltransferase, partial [Actinobacteria bacterium]|nr:acyltransferase [Actinomycetota bacterium]
MADNERPEPRLNYQPAVDGLRAIAVTAVVLYHLGLDWVVGGYLGVEVFFVISGFLITALMLAEFLRTGTVDLRNFWIRRARRLLPALYLFLVGIVAFVALGPTDELVDIRGEVLAALTYITNWFLVLGDVSYFDALGRPSPLQHLWSLALEEQFYLLWPILFSLGLWATRGRQRPLVAAMVVGVVVSTALMIIMYDPGVDPSRVYYGTDTRAAGLLIGSALAMVWSPWRLRRSVGDAAPVLLDAAAFVGVGGLLLLFWQLDELSPRLYRGGFLLTGVLTCLVLAAVVHPAARFSARLLSARPLVWIGLRSYSIYLWHWPVIVFTRPQFDTTLDGWTLHSLRLLLTLVLAELSYTYVETPLRKGALGRWWTTARTDELTRRRGVVIATAVLLPTLLLGIALVRAQPAELEVASTSDVADLIA